MSYQQSRPERCPSCSSLLVQPVDWRRAEKKGCWQVDVRCPECPWHKEAVLFTSDQIDDFEVIFEKGLEELEDDLKRFSRKRWEEDIERFASALRKNHIMPEDFVPPAAR